MTNEKTSVDIFAEHRIDLDAAKDGVWIDVRGDKFKVARFSAPRVLEEKAAFLQEKGLMADDDVPDRFKEEWSARMFGRCILRDAKWQHDPALRYTPEQGETIWTNPQLAGLRDHISAQSYGDYTVKNLKKQALLGNSGPSSNGSASAAPSATP